MLSHPPGPLGADTRTWTRAATASDHSAIVPGSLVMSFLPGEILDGRFRILRLLGQGGMGQVYEAEDLELGVKVALKAIRPERGRHPRSIERFKSEVHLARRVTHPNVCRIFDLFQLRGAGDDWGREMQPQLLVTMELLEGETLSAYLRRTGPLPPAQALPILRELAEALDAAHRAGVMHLDFKSSNVMLSEVTTDSRGETTELSRRKAVVTDFGLARSRELDSAPGQRRGRQGTPAYAAPELIAGAEATPAADIYSFGVVIHEVLTGQLPPQSASPPERTWPAQNKMPQVPDSANSPPRCPVDVRAELPLAWQTTIDRCLEPRPGNRFVRASDVVRSLERGLVHSRWRGPLIAAISAGLALWAGSMHFNSGPVEKANSVEKANKDNADTLAAATSALLLRGPDLGQPQAPEAREYFHSGSEHLRAFELIEACDAFGKAVALDASSAAAHVGLSRCWFERGYEVRAAELARHAVALGQATSGESSPRLDASQRLFLEAWQAEMMRSYPEAVKIYQRLWTASPRLTVYGLRLAKAQTLAGDPQAALETVDTLRGRLLPFPAPPQLDLLEAQAARYHGRLVRQRKAAERAAAGAREQGSQELLAQASLLLADALDRLGARDAAIKALGEARWISESLSDQRGLAWTVLTMQEVVPPAKVPKVVLDYGGAAEIFRDVGDLTGEALSLARWGRHLIRTNDEQGAKDALSRSLALAREINDPMAEAEALNNQGVLVWAMEDSAGSAKLFAEAVETAGTNGNLLLQSRALANLGNALVDLQRLAEARRSYENALAISDDIGSRHDRGMLLSQYAQSLVSLGEIDLAEENYAAALAVAHEISHPRLVRLVKENWAEIDFCHGDYAAALQRFAISPSVGAAPDVYFVISRANWLIPYSPKQAERELLEVEHTLDPGDQWTTLRFRMQLAWAQLEQGQVDDARASLQPYRQSLIDYPEPNVRQQGRLLLARIDAADGNVDSALRMVHESLKEAQDTGAVLQALKIEAQRIQVLRAADKESEAQDSLDLLALKATKTGCPGVVKLAQAG